MAKKRKLNSKNPKYMQQQKDEGPKIQERKLVCIAHPTNTRTGKKNYDVKIPCYAVYYENDD